MAHSDYFMNKYLAFIFLRVQSKFLVCRTMKPVLFHSQPRWIAGTHTFPGVWERGILAWARRGKEGMSKEMGLVFPYWSPQALAVLTCHWLSCFWPRGKSSWWQILTECHPFAQNLSSTGQSPVHTFFALIRTSLENSEWQINYGQRPMTIIVTSKL